MTDPINPFASNQSNQPLDISNPINPFASVKPPDRLDRKRKGYQFFESFALPKEKEEGKRRRKNLKDEITVRKKRRMK
jgi:hypothetical protein